MANKIKIKRGLKANLPTLSVGEQGLCTDTSEIFIGGSTGNIQLANKEYVDSQLAQDVQNLVSHKAENVTEGNPHGIDAKANKSQPANTELTLLNGWSNAGGFSPTASYFKDDFGIVHLFGQITGGVITDGTILFVFPAGFYISDNVEFPILYKDGGTKIASISIFNGEVKIWGVTANTALYLNGITFRA